MSIGTLRVVPIERPAWSTPMSSSHSGVLLGITAGRFLLAASMAVAYLAHAPLVGIGLLAAFIVIDLADGDIARKLGVETGIRRLADGTVDRLSVHLMLAVVATQIPGIIPVWIVLAARDLVQAFAGGRVLLRDRKVVAGAPWHRAYTLALAGWGSIVMLTGSVVTPLAVIVAVIAAVTLVDYLAKVARSDRAGAVKAVDD